MKIIITMFVSTFLHSIVFAQNGTMQGKILNDSSNELQAEVQVFLLNRKDTISRIITDTSGYYKFESIPPGTFSIFAKKNGYSDLLVNGIIVSSNKITFFDFYIKPEEVEKKKCFFRKRNSK